VRQTLTACWAWSATSTWWPRSRPVARFCPPPCGTARTWRCWTSGCSGVDGLTAAAELTTRLPGCRVLILTGLEAPGNRDAARHAGVAGFLFKDGPAGAFIDAVRAVARGDQVIDTRLTGHMPGTGEPGSGA
jgi:hypothetical protein